MLLWGTLALVGLDILLGRVEPLTGGAEDPLVDDGVAVSAIGVQEVHLQAVFIH